MDEANVELYPISNSNAQEVFDQYFDNAPPFHRKKNEFPDAFSLSIVCNQFKNISIITNDDDIYQFEHPNISCNFKSLNEFIDYILKREYSTHDLLIKEYNKCKDEIVNNLKDGFSSLNIISRYGMYTEAPNVKTLNIFNERVIDINDNGAVINFEVLTNYDVVVHYVEKEDTIESDTNFMEIETIFSFDADKDSNKLNNFKIESIKPKTLEDGIVLLHEEDFLNL